jgi:hypothetical protein
MVKGCLSAYKEPMPVAGAIVFQRKWPKIYIELYRDPDLSKKMLHTTFRNNKKEHVMSATLAADISAEIVALIDNIGEPRIKFDAYILPRP